MTNLDTPLSRAATQLSKDIIPQLRNSLNGRHFASINPFLKGDGRTAFEYTAISDMSDGFVQWTLPTGNEHKDSVTATQRVVNIPVLYKEFAMPKADIFAWDNRVVGIGEENSLQAITARTAADKVAEQEEIVIFDGWKPDGTNYAVRGFAAAANSAISGGSIETVGTLFQYIAEAISALEDKKVYGENGSYNVALPTSIMAKVRTLRYTNGDRELAQIEELIGGGSVYAIPSDYLPASTALVLPVDTSRRHIEFLTPVDFRVEFANAKYDNIGNVEGIVYELFTPSYTRVHSNGCTDAICKITNLSP